MSLLNPFVFAALQGALNGLTADPPAGPATAMQKLDGIVLGPLAEESMFRAAMPGSPLLSSAAFAAYHVKPGVSSRRLIDTFVGGLNYAAAYRAYGFAGAVAAHAIHNLVATAVHESRRSPARGAPRRSRSRSR